MFRNKKLLWVALLYLSQGFPFTLITAQLAVYLRMKGSALSDIGVLSLLTLPWSLKIIWAPVVDRYGEKKYWIAAMQFALALIFVAMPLVSIEKDLWIFFSLVFLASTASATADIAIDGYTIQALDQSEIPSGNAARMISWKAASIVATAGVGAIATGYGWVPAFWMGSTFLFLLFPITFLLPKPTYSVPEEQTAISPLRKQFWLNGYVSLLSRSGIVEVLFFVLLYKLGSAFIGPMVRPFWVDQGYSAKEIGIVPGAIGTVETFVAPVVAAWFIRKYKLFGALWIFGILQVLPSLVYAAVAQWHLGRPFIYFASMTESFDISLGTVAFMSFLMLICEKRYAATQYAFLTAIFGFTRAVSGWIGSLGAQNWGYSKFFFFAFFLGFISFPFLPWVKRWIEKASLSTS